jgi:hypothetical protein
LQKVRREQHLETHEQIIGGEHGQNLSIALAGKRNQRATESERNYS